MPHKCPQGILDLTHLGRAHPANNLYRSAGFIPQNRPQWKHAPEHSRASVAIETPSGLKSALHLTHGLLLTAHSSLFTSNQGPPDGVRIR